MRLLSYFYLVYFEVKKWEGGVMMWKDPKILNIVLKIHMLITIIIQNTWVIGVNN